MTAPFWNPAPMITARSHSETSKNEKPSTYYSMTEHLRLMNEQKEFYIKLLKENERMKITWTRIAIETAGGILIFMTNMLILKDINIHNISSFRARGCP